MAQGAFHLQQAGGVRWAKGGPQSNNGMHPTADTAALIFGYRLGRRVMPGVGRF
jgi:hypothetical protein